MPEAWVIGAAVLFVLVLLGEWYTRYSLSGPVVLRSLEEPEPKKQELTVTEKGLDEALVSLKASGAKSYGARVRALRGLLRFFEEEKEAIIEACARDLGRPELETLLYDVFLPRNEILHLLQNLPRLAAWKRVGFDWSLATFPYSGAYLVPEPFGTVLVVGTWNFPFMLSLLPAAGALAAGNSVLLKLPFSGKSQHCSRLIVEKLPRYVDSCGSLKLVVPPTSDYSPQTDLALSKLVLSKVYDLYFFTGSTKVGKIVAEAAAKHLKPAILECGGRNPCYVHHDADLAMAAKRILWGRTLNAGQQCIAPDYVLCERSKVEALCEALRRRVTEAFGDDPSSSPDFGRIVDAQECARLEKLLATVPAENVVCGGRVDAEKSYVAPTVVKCAEGSDFFAAETFGPILPVIPVAGLDSAVAYVNARPKPLSLYAFGRSDDVSTAFAAAQTSAGGCCVNDTIFHAGHPNLPFGGVGDSGYGAYHGDANYTCFSHSKPLLRKATGLLSRVNFFVYPPFSNLKIALFTALMAPSHLFRSRRPVS
mmetsp:Transcript_4922/g.15456  ORF Transcript_4922/g.15456 Transcript_4922/m.15456 type:complete len:536 (+) Transcript_4922:62-1669(+)